MDVQVLAATLYSQNYLIVVALLLGILPPVLWLLFWLYEDRDHPEPPYALWLAFLAGMLAVFVALPLEHLFPMLLRESEQYRLFIWATIEEVVKYIGARWFLNNHMFADEPVDDIIYMITVGLGFAALENVLFLIEPLLGGQILETASLTASRFVGATVLHTISSGIIGIFLAFSFCKYGIRKRAYLILGIIFSIIIHGVFNILILSESKTQIAFFYKAFYGIWAFAILLIVIMERTKRLPKVCDDE